MTELEKWNDVQERFLDFQELLEWLYTKGIRLGEWSKEHPNFMLPTLRDDNDLLYEFLGIDYNKLNRERDELLKTVQEQNKK